MENCAVAAEGGSQIGLVVIRYITVILADCVKRKVEGFVQLLCKIWLEDQIRLRVVRLDMGDVFQQCAMDLVIVIFADA